MRKTRSYMMLIFSLLIANSMLSQDIINPNHSIKSHETLVIKSIELKGDRTVVNLEIENRISGGNFCADKNILLVDNYGRKYRLLKANNIPVCPEVYKFKVPGEKLTFSLEFPPLSDGAEWIDIIEDCPENCFWFYGVTLNAGLNRDLDRLFESASKGTPEENMILFREFLGEIDSRNHGIEGLVYINIINAALEAGDKTEAAVWFERLKKSGAPRVDYYVRYLNDRGIK